MKITDILSDNGSSTMAPRWDGKVVLAAIFIVGYYALIFRISGTHPVPAQNAQMIRDGMLVLGPAIGVIVGALFRTTGADERQNERRSDELKTAITTPSGGTGNGNSTIADATEEGARAGSQAGVSEGVRAAVDAGAITSLGTAAGVGPSGSWATAAPQPYDGPPDGHIPPAATGTPEEPKWPS